MIESDFHILLKRQIKKHFGASENVSPEWGSFLNDIDCAYKESDNDRTMLERSLDLSSDELLQANSEMRGVFQALPDLYFLFKSTGEILDCKGWSTEEFLLPSGNVIGKKIQDIYKNDISDEFLSSIQKTLFLHQPINAEIRISHHQEVRWFESRMVPLTNDKVIALVRNITVRKQTEEHLEESLSLLQATLESTDDGILVVNLEGKIASYNNRFLALWKIPVSIISEKNDESTINYILEQLRSPESFLKKVKELYTNPDSESFDIIEFNDGRIYERYSKPQVIGGKSIGRVWSFRDVTEQKKLSDQLRQSQKLESIGTLASGIAHDFNNVLGIILGHSSLLNLLKEDPLRLSQSIDAITKATQRGASLVKQLLTFARKTDVTITSVNINDMILEVRKLLTELFPKTIIISDFIHKDLPNINADASQIHQVFLNLCVNARDAMPINGTLTISTSTVEGKTIRLQFTNATAWQYVKIEVADTGIGMDEATRKRIFEPFFTTKDIGKGTGLGLATVFGIVENINGFIDVQSTVGKGTTFTIYFPVPEHAPEVSQTNDKQIMEIRGGTETILLIEDEEMLRELVKTVLITKGYTVLTAEDGVHGVEMYRRHEHEISLVLSDMGLPLLSGQDVVKNIRDINPAAKVIIASGFIDPKVKSEMSQSGIEHFIQKPYLQDELLLKVREVLDTNG